MSFCLCPLYVCVYLCHWVAMCVGEWVRKGAHDEMWMCDQSSTGHLLVVILLVHTAGEKWKSLFTLDIIDDMGDTNGGRAFNGNKWPGREEEGEEVKEELLDDEVNGDEGNDGRDEGAGGGGDGGLSVALADDFGARGEWNNGWSWIKYECVQVKKVLKQ